ncbi:MAG: NTP transferase domain-containing protein, partial [Aestuariivirga sp.]
MTELALVVLAAGMGTRMKSAIPKVLHKIAGRSLLGHVLHAGLSLGSRKVVVVLGPDMGSVQKEASGIISDCEFAEQRDRLGTGHAVSMAKEALVEFKGVVLVLYGDAPLVKPDTLRALVGQLDGKTKMVVLGFEAQDPHGYGRLITKGKKVLDIREELDCNIRERKIKLCNSGIIAIDNAL